ncbi:MAG: NAD(P)-dependent oxidoreductase [Caldilineaceae bacterium]|nr:NAD(P)-dependent oxidoreductase [Caldilineaceae bacterium]
MQIEAIGIVSPGDMGHVVGQVLREDGLRVITCLAERSDRTKALAKQAGLEDLPSYADLVVNADAIFSILVPAEAPALAEQIAQAIRKTRSSPLYVDFNAISPATARSVGKVIEEAGGRFVDGSIIGPPPRTVGATRFYVSGRDAGELEVLNDYGLHVIPIGQRVGDASALKMCYAALTKGLTALSTELMVAAQALGVAEALDAEFRQSQSAMLARMERGLPTMPPKSRRWVGEMEEIADTFASVGLTPNILRGAADIYRFVGDTPLADRNPEDPGQPTLAEMITQLAAHLKQ